MKKFKVTYFINAHYGEDGGMFNQEYIEQETTGPENITLEEVAAQIKQASHIYVKQKQPNGKARLIVINRAHITHFQIDEV